MVNYEFHYSNVISNSRSASDSGYLLCGPSGAKPSSNKMNGYIRCQIEANVDVLDAARPRIVPHRLYVKRMQQRVVERRRKLIEENICVRRQQRLYLNKKCMNGDRDRNTNSKRNHHKVEARSGTKENKTNEFDSTLSVVNSASYRSVRSHRTFSSQHRLYSIAFLLYYLFSFQNTIASNLFDNCNYSPFLISKFLVFFVRILWFSEVCECECIVYIHCIRCVLKSNLRTVADGIIMSRINIIREISPWNL